MHIWVDADACPVVIKEILFRAAERLEIPTILFANKLLRTPPSRFIRAVQVAAGLDVADREIVSRLEPGDLVITADVPLAADVIGRGAHALSPRGEFYTPGRNMEERLRCGISSTHCAAAACRPAGRRRSTTPTGSGSRTSSTDSSLPGPP